MHALRGAPRLRTAFPVPTMADSSIPHQEAETAAGFSPTEWSLVLAAHSSSSRRREALETLCATYWPPIYGYLRRRGNSPADAEDLTQGFFLHLIESDFLDRPEASHGRFRGFLVGALKHFLGSHFEREGAVKRGGRVEFIDWKGTEAESEFAALGLADRDPTDAFDTSWALTLLGSALKRLELEQDAAGKGRQFVVLKPYLSRSPSRGDYDRAAEALGTSRTTVAVWVHRLTQRYGELVRLAVRATVREPGDADAELRHLLNVLGRETVDSV